MKMIKNLKRKTKVYAVILLMGMVSFTTYSFTESYFEVQKNLDIFATLFRELSIYYVDETKPGDLMKTSIDQMLESLDPYTVYYPESEIEDARIMVTGQYGGVGAGIHQNGDYVVIAEPYEGYPAQKSDLRAGDKILEVNGISAKGKKTDDVSKILKGNPNTTVKVLIEREGEKKPIEKTLTREEIKIKNVPYYTMLDENTGYIKLSGFTENANVEVKDALTELKKNAGFKYLVFDLRGNGGGLLREAVEIVNLFVPQGTEIVSSKGKVKEWDVTNKATKPPFDLTTPMVVLVNRNSASASEIVSGALQDLDRAVIIGQRSYGKGLVQQTRPLSYNAQLKVTVAKYYLPSGRCIQALDYSHKNDDGSVEKVPDSLISAFKTKAGRIMYDGAGIAPDVALDAYKYSNIAISLGNKNFMFDYATKYRLAHASIPPAKEFKLSDAEYNDFVTYVKDKEYDYTTKTEKALKDFKEVAEKEKNWDVVKDDYEMMKKKITHDKSIDLVTYKEEIRQLLEEEIASRYAFQKGRLDADLVDDKEVKESIAVLKDSDRYSKILTTIAKAEHPFYWDKHKNDKTNTSLKDK